jgi:hypothetical protein
MNPTRVTVTGADVRTTCGSETVRFTVTNTFAGFKRNPTSFGADWLAGRRGSHGEVTSRSGLRLRPDSRSADGDGR